jgi:uncharacterized protein YggE
MHVFLLSVLITVSAQGRASAAPDMATENFTIATNADTAAAAASDNNARYNRLMQALESLGIAHADIRTTFYNLNYTPPPQQPPQPQAGMPPVRERYGYFVNRNIQITLHRLDLVGKAIDVAVASGVTDIGGVSFGVTNSRAQFAQALRSAVSDARQRADAMAAAAGLHITRVKSMQQGYAEAPSPRIMMAAAAPGAAAPPTEIEPSSVEVSATVTVTYEAQ